MSIVNLEERLMVVSDRQSVAKSGPLAEPLEFATFLRPQVWGGNALGTQLGKSFGSDVPIGEAWEISGLLQHPSIVSVGEFAGESLADLWRTRSRELAGRTVAAATFPLFVKWLDCHDWLSVQVHPNDALAREMLGQETGKTEAWVVVHAEPTARVYAGLKADVTLDEFVNRLKDGTVAECLHSFVPKVGDCVSLPAGTIHAAGGGVVFAEVQQPSDATFRMFDWNRLGLDGQPRTLHHDQAIKCVSWPQPPVSPTAPEPLNCPIGVVGERLLETPAFAMERYVIGESWSQPHSGEMTVWMVLDGIAVLDAGEESLRLLKRGATILLPAGVREAKWSAEDPEMPCTLLCIRLPATVE